MKLLFLKHPLAVIILFAVLLILPGYLLGMAGSDVKYHGLWVKHFAAILSQGYVYPRFASEMNAGFGSFAFFFYPPVSLYADSIFYRLGSDADFNLTALNASMMLVLAVSGCTCYIWLRSKARADYTLICALFYMAMPSHILYELYFAKMVSQFWCYAWFPLIIWGTEKTVLRQKYGIPLLAVSGALLLMTNIPIAIIFPPFAVIYGIFYATNLKSSVHLIAAWLLAFAIAAVYLLPVYAYQDFATIKLHWDAAFGFKYDEQFLDKNLYSKTAKPVNFLLFLYLLITAFYSLFFYYDDRKSKNAKVIFILCLFSYFMCFSVSDFIWRMFPILQKIQFPWRFLSISPVFLMLAALAALQHQEVVTKKRILQIILSTFFAIGMMVMIYNFGSMKAVNQREHLWYDSDTEASLTYLPSEKLIKYFNPPISEVLNYPKVKIQDGDVNIIHWQSRDIQLVVNGTKDSVITIRQFYFPGWVAEVNGQKLAVSKDEKLDILKVTLPENVKNATLQLTLQTLPAEKYGRDISLLGLLIVGILLVKDQRAKV